jgi:hypothetical protein
MPDGATVTQLGSGEKSGFALLSNGSLASWGTGYKGSLLNGLSGTQADYGPKVRDTRSIGIIKRIANIGKCRVTQLVNTLGQVFFVGDGSSHGMSGTVFYQLIV